MIRGLLSVVLYLSVIAPLGAEPLGRELEVPGPLGPLEGTLLVLQGERDLQVGRIDAERLGNATANARLVLLPDANHLLKEVTTDDRAENLDSFSNPNLPLAPGVIDSLSDFIGSAQ